MKKIKQWKIPLKIYKIKCSIKVSSQTGQPLLKILKSPGPEVTLNDLQWSRKMPLLLSLHHSPGYKQMAQHPHKTFWCKLMINKMEQMAQKKVELFDHKLNSIHHKIYRIKACHTLCKKDLGSFNKLQKLHNKILMSLYIWHSLVKDLHKEIVYHLSLWFRWSTVLLPFLQVYNMGQMIETNQLFKVQFLKHKEETIAHIQNLMAKESIKW